MSELKISKVVLYSHGVAYFERTTDLQAGDSNVTLSFAKTEINDVLKSLLVVDKTDSGVVKSVSYEYRLLDDEPGADSLTRKRPLIGDNCYALEDSIFHMRGVSVTVTIAKPDGNEETSEGVIVGLSHKNKVLLPNTSNGGDLMDEVDEDDAPSSPKAPKKKVVKVSVVTLLSNDTLRSIEVPTVKSVQINDPAVKKEFAESLSRSLQNRRKEPERVSRDVTIFARGSDKRKLVASYILENPRWRSSYRISIAPQAATTASGAATTDKVSATEGTVNLHIEGWAIIDNVRSEDWENVRLSLVTGLPISYRLDLASAHLRPRPWLKLEEEGALLPVNTEVTDDLLVVNHNNANAVPTSAPSNGFGSAATGGSVFGSSPYPPPSSFGSAAPQQQQQPQAHNYRPPQQQQAPQPAAFNFVGDKGKKDWTTAQAAVTNSSATQQQSVSEQYCYEVKQPVTVRKNQSALVPFINVTLPAKLVAIYNQTVRDKNPFTALLFDNNAGCPLPAGPTTVYRNEIYVGEAVLPSLKPSERSVLPFNVEASVHVSSSTWTDYFYVSNVSLTSGVLTFSRPMSTKTTYTFANKSTDRKILLLLEHPLRANATLLTKENFLESTKKNHRFLISLEPKSKTVFEVVQQMIHTSSVSIGAELEESQIRRWAENKAINADIAQELTKALSIFEKLAQKDRDVQEMMKDLADLYKDYARVCENLGVMVEATSQETELRTRWVSQLVTMEEQFVENRNALKELVEAGLTLEKDLNQLRQSWKIQVRLDNPVSIDPNAGELRGFSFGGAPAANRARVGTFQQYQGTVQEVSSSFGSMQREAQVRYKSHHPAKPQAPAPVRPSSPPANAFGGAGGVGGGRAPAFAVQAAPQPAFGVTPVAHLPPAQTGGFFFGSAPMNAANPFNKPH